MRSIISILLIIILFYKLPPAYSQTNNNIFLEIKYPFPTGQNFLSNAYDDGYTGFFNIGMGYNRKTGDQLGAGVYLGTMYLKLLETNMNLLAVSPAIRGLYYFPVESERNKVIQMVEVGYSLWNFFSNDLKFPSDTTVITGQDGHYSESRHGFAIGGSTKVSYLISDRISADFIFEFHFYRLNVTKKEERGGFNQNVAILFPGLGISVDL